MGVKMTVKRKDISLEWSFSQKFFHIEPVEQAIRSNISLFINGGGTDYVLLGIFSSWEEASEAADILRKKRPDIFTNNDDIERMIAEMEEETEIGGASRKESGLSQEVGRLITENEGLKKVIDKLKQAIRDDSRNL